MKITQFECAEVNESGLHFDRADFGSVNLLVGNSATGKSTFLHTVFNACLFVTRNRFYFGSWSETFEHRGEQYQWHLRTSAIEPGRDESEETGIIEEEWISVKRDDIWVPLIDRRADQFVYSGESLPKLSKRESAIRLLKDEESIKPIYQALEMVMRRRFSHDALSSLQQINAVPDRILTTLQRTPDIKKVYEAEFDLNINLYLLSQFFKPLFNKIKSQFRQTFPFVEEIRIEQLSRLRTNISVAANVPVVQIREKSSRSWVPLREISSGMQKVLLILTDVILCPEGSVYIIDEYENSLGLNAIGFFPDFIQTLGKEMQFFITSHHPYIINKIPVENWYVFHRNGGHVSIRFGKDLVEHYGQSKQQAFVRLINDPFFSEGVQ